MERANSNRFQRMNRRPLLNQMLFCPEVTTPRSKKRMRTEPVEIVEMDITKKKKHWMSAAEFTVNASFQSIADDCVLSPGKLSLLNHNDSDDSDGKEQSLDVSYEQKAEIQDEEDEEPPTGRDSSPSDVTDSRLLVAGVWPEFRCCHEQRSSSFPFAWMSPPKTTKTLPPLHPRRRALPVLPMPEQGCRCIDEVELFERRWETLSPPPYPGFNPSSLNDNEDETDEESSQDA